MSGRARSRRGARRAVRTGEIRIRFEFVSIGHKVGLESRQQSRLCAEHRVELVPLFLAIRVVMVRRVGRRGMMIRVMMMMIGRRARLIVVVCVVRRKIWI